MPDSFKADLSSSEALFVVSLNGIFRGVSIWAPFVEIIAESEETIENRESRFLTEITVFVVQIYSHVASHQSIFHFPLVLFSDLFDLSENSIKLLSEGKFAVDVRFFKICDANVEAKSMWEAMKTQPCKEEEDYISPRKFFILFWIVQRIYLNLKQAITDSKQTQEYQQRSLHELRVDRKWFLVERKIRLRVSPFLCFEMFNRRGGGKFRGGNRNFQQNDRFQGGKSKPKVIFEFIPSLLM